jgi:magnesium transporter
MIVDKAIYVDGRREAEPETVREIYEACQRRSGVAWIGLYRPTEEEFGSAAEEFNLHPLAVEDAVKAHQRPKLERYGKTLFVVLKAARYVDATEEVEFGEASALGEVRGRLEDEPNLLRRGPGAILYAIMDSVVDGYNPVVEGLKNDVDEIETEVFGGNAAVSRRIYTLSREVIEFQRAAKPLAGVLDHLVEGGEEDVDPEVRRYLRDVQDHVYRVIEQVDGFRELLQSILSVNLTMVSLAQNEKVTSLTQASITQNDQTKKISGWAAILFAPSLVGAIYGMNFDYMPELHWIAGYPLALLLMVLISGTLYLVFKRRGWL